MPQVPYDPLAGILARTPIPQSARADAWDAFHDAENEDDLAQRLEKLSLPQRVKADLWDLKSGYDARTPATSEEFTMPKGQRIDGASFGEKIKNAAAFLGNEVVGAAKGAAHTALDIGQTAVNAGVIPGQIPGAPNAAVRAGMEATPYSNLGQQVGGGLETVAELAMPLTKAVEAIPSAARAGKAFQEVMGAAKQVPIDVSEPGNVALRIADLAQRGGGTQWGPPPVRQFIQYVTDPKKPAMTYEVARDFASNISRLSAKDLASIPPAVMREIGNLRMTLNKSVADAANVAGKGSEYASAMTEYAKAKRLQGVLDDIAAGAQRAVPYLGAGAAFGSGNWLTKHLVHLWGGE